MNALKHITPAPAVLVALIGSWTAAYSQPAPCSLLTQNQVSSVLGVGVGAGASIANTGCSWRSSGASKVMVTVSMQSSRMFEGAKSSTPPKGAKAAVSGVGDEAIFVGVDNFESLWVKKGASYFLVRIYGLPMADAQNKAKALAQSVASKL